MKKKLLSVIVLSLVSIFAFSACGADLDLTWQLNKDFDLTLPNLSDKDWEKSFEDNFDGNSIDEEKWNLNDDTEKWSSDMVRVEDGNAVIKAQSLKGDGEEKTLRTGGIKTKGSAFDFSQAYGFFEVRAMFIRTEGVYTYFTLEPEDANKGIPVNVYKSVFYMNPNRMAHSIVVDNSKGGKKLKNNLVQVTNSLYNDYHTFALKWTPDNYVFYIDGKATWATHSIPNFSSTENFIKIAASFDDGKGYGPYEQRIGKFKEEEAKDVLKIDYVKVYQNVNYIK